MNSFILIVNYFDFKSKFNYIINIILIMELIMKIKIVIIMMVLINEYFIIFKALIILISNSVN